MRGQSRVDSWPLTLVSVGSCIGRAGRDTSFCVPFLGCRAGSSSGVRWRRSVLPLVWGLPARSPVWAGAQLVAGRAPGVLRVGPGVVGQHALGGDVLGGKPCGGPDVGGRAGRGCLIGEMLGVGEPGVVIECGMQVEVTVVCAGLVGAAGGPAECLVAGAVGEAAELLDVDVDQFAGGGAFVAAHRPTGGPVQACQRRRSVITQGAMRGGGGHSGAYGQPERSVPVFLPQAPGVLRSRRWSCGVSDGGGWSGRTCRPSPAGGGGRPTVWRWCGRPGTVQPPGAAARRPRPHIRPNVVCRSVSAGHCGGT